MLSFSDREYRLTCLGKIIQGFSAHCTKGFLLLRRSDESACPPWLKATHLLLVFVVTILVVGLFSVMEVDPHHDGIMLKPAVDVANGKMLFRDTFSQYGALTVLVQALAIKIFGGELIVLRFLTTLFYGLIAVLQWLIYSRLLPIWANAISWAIWLSLGYFFLDIETLIVIPSATVFPIFSILLSIYLLILYFEKDKQAYIWMSGMAAACTFWFKINYGIIHFGTMVLLLSLLEFSGSGKNRFRSLWGLVFGCCLVHLCFLLWLFSHRALNDFWIQSVRFGYLFAMNNQFSTNDPFLIRVIACLFQIDSKHGGISFLWTFLPLISTVTCGYVCSILVKKRTIGFSEKVILSTSLFSVGLWFAYFPMSSVYHMYLSSSLSLGVVFYLLWGITRPVHVQWRRPLQLICVILIFYPDVSMRAIGCVQKVTKFSEYEKIESPGFLRGMYVPSKEARVYAKIGSIIEDYPDYNMMNLTKDGLYSLYNMNNHEFHKMHVNWGWINNILYPEYLPRLREQIAARSHIIMTNDSFCVEGYIPVAVFPRMGKGPLESKVVLHIPGESRDGFKVARIGRASELPCFGSASDFPLIQAVSTSNEPVKINSVIVKVYVENFLYHNLNKFDLEYDVLARAMNWECEELIKEWYHFDDEYNQYSAGERANFLRTSEILDAVDDLFLCERYSFVANTFRASGIRQVAVFRNGEPRVPEGGNQWLLQCSRNDAIQIIPLLRFPRPSILKLRINYNRNQYYETTIYSPDQRYSDATR